MPPQLRSSILALGAVSLLASSGGASALDLGVSLGGVDVGVSVGGDSGVGVDVGVGDTDVSVGVGGSQGLGVDLDVDLDGDGVPETSSGGATVQPLGQEGALQAVKSNRALPLEDILTRARLVTDGEIIDAQLIQVRRILVYEIKVLGKSGDVKDLYFYARSGALVTSK
ncbi:MAG: hypothetical protein EOP02_14160 [Proteobacteria bacterium]|nr:MAG: hypothetical protein EOP02_14160 [Pseudomonadota bacterium]